MTGKMGGCYLRQQLFLVSILFRCFKSNKTTWLNQTLTLISTQENYIIVDALELF